MARTVQPVAVSHASASHVPASHPITTATRAWALPKDRRQKQRKGGRNEFPDLALVFDCETTTDEIQRLTFGAYRVYAHRDHFDRIGTRQPEEWTLVEEGLFCADDLEDIDGCGLTALRDYAASRLSDAPTGYRVRRKPLRLRSRREFVDDVLCPLAVQAQALVVGFNLPFDISRIAVECAEARGMNDGGFSFIIWQDDHDGVLHEHPFRPRITIRTIDSKRAIIQLRGRGKDGRTDFRGHFLDLRTLAFALSDRGHSLASACRSFGVEHGKYEAAEHGVITPAYIDYCRNDVRATWELFVRLRDEYLKHPIPLQATKAYSPASIGKGYLDAMRVRVPELVPDPTVGLTLDGVTGAAMQAYYGGRAECRIRRTPVPVVYVDFLSMYPTVNTLMGLWDYLTAERIRVLDATEDVRAFLASVTLADLFDPATWRRLPALVQVMPGGDVLPVRAQYGTQDFQIGVNHLTAAFPVWYPLADCLAAKLLHPEDKVPAVVKALGLVPEGTQRGLRSVKLGGTVCVNPRRDNLFKKVIEQRKSLPMDLPREERERLDKFLKVFANATSYGVFVEMNRQEGQEAACSVWTGGAEPFISEPVTPEEPGGFCFPPLGVLITGAARLMLALLERCVTDLGGTYAFCDTDSMAIVASEPGGAVECPGGPELTADGCQAVRVLTWDQVEGIVSRFAALNPYDREAIPGSVLKVEDVNFTTERKQREVLADGISAKRYDLYEMRDRVPVVLDARAHGLGHLLDPTARPRIAADGVDEEDGGSKTKPWHRDVWENENRAAFGLPARPLPWLDRMTVGRITVSKPDVSRAFTAFNRGKPYQDRIKPFNFIMTAHLDGMERMALRGKAARTRLVAPYERDPSKWERLRWWNLYPPHEPYCVRTHTGAEADAYARPGVLTVQSYGDVLDEYRTHPEAKSANADGQPCDRRTVGLLHRRHVVAMGERPRFIGKESNELEAVQDGLIGDVDDVCTEYRRTGDRLAVLRRALNALPGGERTAVARQAGITRQQLSVIAHGRESPHERTQAAIEQATRRSLSEGLRLLDAVPPHDWTLSLDALTTAYTDVVEKARAAVGRRLAALAACIGERDAAALLGVAQKTVNRYRAGRLPCDPSSIATVARRLCPYADRLDRWATLTVGSREHDWLIQQLRQAASCAALRRTTTQRQGTRRRGTGKRGGSSERSDAAV